MRRSLGWPPTLAFRFSALVSRIASASALWVLLGFVLGGLAAPVLHAVQHTTECTHADGHHAHAGHAHDEDSASSHLVAVAADHTESPCFACALCAVPLTSTTAEAKAVSLASCTTGELRFATATVPESPTASLYAPRGPPTC